MPSTRPSIHPKQCQFHKNRKNQFQFLNNQKLHRFLQKNHQETSKNKKNNPLNKNLILSALNQATKPVNDQWGKKMAYTKDTEVAKTTEETEDQR
jgi:hypothetical protein